MRPPAARNRLGAGEPLLGIIARGAAAPVAALVLRRRVDDAGDVATGAEHELRLPVELWLLPKLGIKAPPWTIHNTVPDNLKLKPASESAQITYPKPDGVLTFDRLSSVFISNKTK